MYEWYQSNLLAWLETHITQLATDRVDNKNFGPEEHWTFINEKRRRYVKSNNLSGIINQIPSEFLVWTLEHQLAVADYLEKVCLGEGLDEIQKVGQFKYHIWLVSAILADLEEIDLQERPEFKVLEELLRFLRNEFSRSFPLDYQVIEAKIAHRQSEHAETTRPTCPECESSHVVSHSGINWLCQSCGRAWRKNPRRKRHND